MPLGDSSSPTTTTDSSETSSDPKLDPTTSCVQLLIPVTFPGDLNLRFHCIQLLSSNSSPVSSSWSSSDSPSPSQNEEIWTSGGIISNRKYFEPIDEAEEENLDSIFLKTEIDKSENSEEVNTIKSIGIELDFEEFPEVTSTTTTTSSKISISSNESKLHKISSKKSHRSKGKRGRLNSGSSSWFEEDEEELDEEINGEWSTSSSLCPSFENPNPTPCIHCQGSRDHDSLGDELIWTIPLDTDLIETLIRFCPQIFEDMDPTCNSSKSLEDGLNSISSPTESQTENMTSMNLDGDYEVSKSSPPNVQVDESPLQPSLDKNKESLKVKLLLRRPMNQLVEQGILPPPKTPPAFAEQRVRLERARMGDLLKAKIQQRPARQELIRQHILEDSDAKVAPSLAEKQRMLKRARLADSLNDHLIHRPGPLELVQKNILHAPDAIIDQAIKEGAVQFKATSEGIIPGPHVPSNIYLSEDESSSDLSSPAGTPDHSSSNEIPKGREIQQLPSSSSITSVLVSSLPSDQQPILIPSLNHHHPGSIQNKLLSKIVKAAVTTSTTPPITSAQLTLSQLSNLEHQQLLSSVQQKHSLLSSPRSLSSTIPVITSGFTGSTKRSAKKNTPKIKSQTKARQIKFHEYKGPPSALKCQSQQQQQDVESSYELLLQQQQLFLQWQLECRHKYPQIILPAVSTLKSPTEVTRTFASAVQAASATMVSASIVGPTAATTSPLVRSPSSIATVLNKSSQQAIAPAPPPQPPLTVQALVEKYNKTAASVSTTLPLKLALPTILPTEIRPKPTPPSRSVSESSNSAGGSPRGSFSSSSSSLDLSKLSEWKVSDLKAELKKRNLPVSGAKPQLIERLKSADPSLQDESISSSSSVGTTRPNIKTDGLGTMTEDPQVSEMMDVSDSGNGISREQEIKSGNNLAALNAAMLTLVQGNTGNVIPVHILNALANVAKSAMSDNNIGQKIIPMDDKGTNTSREQQIEELQQALQAAQTQQRQQIKIVQTPPPASGQRHRLALQQHLQQKMQQQALQAQLQKLIQLHTLQQQQQHANAVKAAAALSAEKPMPGKLMKPQQQLIQILPHTKPQRACAETLTLHQSEEGDGSNTINSTTNILLTNVNTSSNPTPDSTVPIRILTMPMSFSSPAEGQANIPQVKILAFQAGENDMSSSPSTTKSGSFSSESGDPMDHSWLLKINETPTPPSPPSLIGGEDDDEMMPKKSVVKEYANFFENFASGGDKKELPKLQIPKSRQRDSIKSQIVDDVLEILIRNGELPASAAQEPPTPTTPGKAPHPLQYSNDSNSIGVVGPTKVLSTPPPPPPLPPPSFTVTLPTSITFSKSPTANNIALSPFPVIEDSKGPPPPYPSDSLSKEARDILKISLDLSNFGKAHAEASVLAGTDSNNTMLFSTTNPDVLGDYDSNALAMLLDEVEKDGMNSLAMEMDNHPISTDFPVSETQGFSTSFPQSRITSNVDEEMNVVEPKHEDLFGFLGNLLPPGLDVSIPMEMDYSDWLDGFLPVENHTGNSVTETFSIPGHNNNNLGNIGPVMSNNNYFMDYNSSPTETFSGNNRDPLLSSRSFNIFNTPSTVGTGGLSNSQEVKRATSPMAIGESLLWDFV